MIDELKNLLGQRCTGVKINGDSYPFLNKPEREMKFCEAVNYSFQLPLQIDNNTLGCPGARRSLGFDEHREELILKIAKNTQIPASYIRNTFEDIPVIQQQIDHLILGIPGDLEESIIPDLYISYTSPKNIMRLMHLMAKDRSKPVLPPYSFNSICGIVFSKAYQEQRVMISFGCPESREFGGVKDGEVIVGIPYALAGKLTLHH
jgi:uncharacterized protein (DUF169 family)